MIFTFNMIFTFKRGSGNERWNASEVLREKGTAHFRTVRKPSRDYFNLRVGRLVQGSSLVFALGLESPKGRFDPPVIIVTDSNHSRIEDVVKKRPKDKHIVIPGGFFRQVLSADASVIGA